MRLHSKSFLKNIAVTIAIILAGLLLDAQPAAAAKQPAAKTAAAFSIIAAHPFLADASPLLQELDAEKIQLGITSLGAFGIGNGHVFALTGIDYPQNLLLNIVGPIYEKEEELQFYDVSHRLEDAAGKAIPLPRTKLYRIRRTSIIVCEERGAGLAMLTVTYAPPDSNTIVRDITVKNISSAALPAFRIAAIVSGKAGKAEPYEGGRLVQHVKDRRMVVSFAGHQGEATPGALALKAGPLAPGAEARFTLFVTPQFENEKYAVRIPGADASKPAPALDATRNWWLKWFDGTLETESSDPRLAGVFESIAALMKVQMSAGSGVSSPMGRYSGFWCRDNYGPLRFFLADGHYADARRSIEYFDLATRKIGFRNRYPLDVDTSDAPASIDWNKFKPQEGDDPSLLILQAYYYWKASGDDAFIAARYGFLQRNIDGQSHTEFRLPFNGDETYQVYVMMQESEPMKNFFTPASGFLFVTAARAMAEISTALGKKDDAARYSAMAVECAAKTEEFYWNDGLGYYIPYVKKKDLSPGKSPFADVNLSPLWMNYASAADEKQRRNVRTTVEKLLTSRDLMKTTARVQLYTGMVPGILLHNLKAIGDLATGDRVYAATMKRVLSKSGEFAENYDNRDNWLNYGAAATVYRPWESGINANAILYYITGLKTQDASGAAAFQPHLPPGIDWLNMKNLYTAAGRPVSLELRRAKNGALNGSIKNTGKKKLDIVVLLEPAAGAKPPKGFAEFASPDYGRTLWRAEASLAPGKEFKF